MTQATNEPEPDLAITHTDALNLLRVVTDAAVDFMNAYPGPESCRLVRALETANRLVCATAEGSPRGRRRRR